MVERVKSPIVGTFIFAWFFYNWKIILILLFGKGDVENKIDIISSYVTAKSFYYPFSFAVLYCILIPIVTLFIDVLLRKVSEGAIEIRYEKINKEYKEKKKTEILRADADIAYERQKTDSEKEIQEMRESITVSKEREGVLVKEKENAINEKNEIIKEKEAIVKEKNETIQDFDKLKSDYLNLSEQMVKMHDAYAVKIKAIRDESNENGYSSVVNYYKGEIIKKLNIHPSVSMHSLYIDWSKGINDKNIINITNIPDIHNQYPQADSLFSLKLKFYEFLDSLTIEQLLHYGQSVLDE